MITGSVSRSIQRLYDDRQLYEISHPNTIKVREPRNEFEAELERERVLSAKLALDRYRVLEYWLGPGRNRM